MIDPQASSADPAAPAAEPAHAQAAAPARPGVLPLSEEDKKFWREEIERSDKKREDMISRWDVKGNIERYTHANIGAGSSTAGDIDTGKDFSDVEQKKSALFYDTPEIALIPDPGTDGSVLQLHQELLNSLLGPKRMDAKATVLPTVQDCLVAIQPVPTEIGYASVSVDVPQPAPLDPVTGQAAIDPLTGLPAQPTNVPVIVWEEIFWRKISANAQLLPVLLKHTKYDASPWLGHRWLKPISQVKREFPVLGPDWNGGAESKTKPWFEATGESGDNGEKMVGGVKIWYRAVLRDPNVTHPDVVRVLEWIDGDPEPVVHQNLPWQEIGKDGRLTPNSMIGYPNHPLALRDLTDSAYVAADLTVVGPLTRELNLSRTNNILQRDGNRLHVLYDAAKLNPEVRDKVEQGKAPKFIPVEPGSLENGIESVMQQVPALNQGRESFLIQDIIERDRDGVLGMNQNTQNPNAEGGKTATEVKTVQRNTDARFEQERQRVLQWWLAGVQKVSALALRYGDRMAMDILGPQRGQAWVQARDAGQFNRFSFEIVIDSGTYIDVEARKANDLKLYEMTAKDPTLNRSTLQARMATDFGIDPASWLVTKQPEEKPEPPTVSISVKPEDLDPSLPSYVGTYAILTAGGVKGLPPPQAIPIQPPSVMPNVPDHGGMPERTEHINKHQSDLTGDRSGPKVM